jgi:hypothetical protein
MKTSKTISAFFAAAILLAPFISCKKIICEKEVKCRIVTISDETPTRNILHAITYNNEGKIASLTSSGNPGIKKLFTYTGNTLMVKASNAAGQFSGRDSVTFDSRGRVINVRLFFTGNGANWINHKYEYNGDELLRLHQTSSTIPDIETFEATYVNGNMVRLGSPFAAYTFEYYLDKKAQDGDFLNIDGIAQFGVSLYPHKNLVKSVNIGGPISNLITYEFNADGLISKYTATGGDGDQTSTRSYQYECN